MYFSLTIMWNRSWLFNRWVKIISAPPPLCSILETPPQTRTPPPTRLTVRYRFFRPTPTTPLQFCWGNLSLTFLGFLFNFKWLIREEAPLDVLGFSVILHTQKRNIPTENFDVSVTELGVRGSPLNFHNLGVGFRGGGLSIGASRRSTEAATAKSNL